MPNVIRTAKDLRELAKTLVSKNVVAIDYETQMVEQLYEDMSPDKVISVGLAWWEDDNIPPDERTEDQIHSAYIPFNHIYLEPQIFADEPFLEVRVEKQIDPTKFVEVFHPLIFNHQIMWAMHNAKFDMWITEVLFKKEPWKNFHDTMMWAKLVDENGRMGLKPLTGRYLGREAETFEDLTAGHHNVAAVDIDQMAGYCEADARNTLQLAAILGPKVDADNQWNVWENLWKPVTVCIKRMERRGVHVDVAYMHRLKEQCERICGVIEHQVYEAAGKPVNLRSAQQVAEMLFDDLKCPEIEGRSTKESVLKHLARLGHPVPALLVHYRGIQNTLGKEINGVLERLDPYDRVHANFVKFPKTGRLSCNNPNLQNVKRDDSATIIETNAAIREVIDPEFLLSREQLTKMLKRPPEPDEFGYRLGVRRAFVAPPGHKFLLGDYSQLELRLMAHFSHDELLMKAYREGLDVHQQTADLVGCTRNQAKGINFGLIYKMQWKKLATVIDTSWEEAKVFHTNFFDSYSGVAKHHDRLVAKARRNGGWVNTILGRRRRCPEILGDDWMEQMDGERKLINSQIQGSAADLIDAATVAIEDSGLDIWPVMQVHDELNCYCPEDQAEEMMLKFKEIMETAIDGIRVPIIFDAKIADNWAQKG